MERDQIIQWAREANPEWLYPAPRGPLTELAGIEGFLAGRLGEQDWQTCVRSVTALRRLLEQAHGISSTQESSHDAS